MNGWWKSLKISVAGAKLSHLVQKDKIWDHGSMVEHVRTIVVLLKKAVHHGDATIIKKCMTDTGYKKIKDSIMHIKKMKTFAIENELDKVNIIDVTPGKNGRRDSFTASLKFKKNPANEEWHFVRQGEWWIVDEIT